MIRLLHTHTRETPRISFFRSVRKSFSRSDAKPALAEPAVVEITEFYSGRQAPQKVKQSFAVLADEKVPLYTGSLFDCVTLIALGGKKTGKHLLAHIDSEHAMKKALKLVRQKMGIGCELYIRAGKDPQALVRLKAELAKDGFKAPTVLELGAELGKKKAEESRIGWIPGTFSEECDSTSVCTQTGKMYAMRKNQEIAYPPKKSEFDLRWRRKGIWF